MSLITLDPTNGPFGTNTIAMAPRPATVTGQTLGIVADGCPGSEQARREAASWPVPLPGEAEDS